MKIDVIPVQSPSDLKAFIDLPWWIYRGDRHWVPPLRSEVKKRLDRSTYPFFDYGAAEFFLARRDARVVGRIAAIKNDRHINIHEEPVGFFGFFECIQDQEVADALFSRAADWLSGHRLEVMRGPVSYSTNDECALLVDGFDSSPVIMMPYNPRYYLDLIEGFGFQTAKDLLAYEITDDVPVDDRLSRIIERTRRRNRIMIRPFKKKQLDQEVQYVKDIYNSAWEQNWGFVPMTDREIDHMAADLKRIIDENIVLFAEIEGEPVGFMLALPDFYQAQKHANGRLFPFGLAKILWHARKIDAVRILAFGVKAEYRQQGVDALLYHDVYVEGKKRGYRRGELSWILEDNAMMNSALQRMGARVYKRYRIYDYPLKHNG
ncbi:MAG: GNAT family N-acetyltransferase [Candidatus Poribacteria bacterium]|nr:GNAT family N-acetyltransferase [Candidatus Poribacteria bacterium]